MLLNYDDNDSIGIDEINKLANHFDSKLREINANYRNVRDYSNLLQPPKISKTSYDEMTNLRQQFSYCEKFSGQGKVSCLIQSRDLFRHSSIL